MVVWCKVPGLKLWASSDGQIYDVFSRAVPTRQRTDGYILLTHEGVDHYVHRLVCAAFYGPAPFPGAEVDHEDRDRSNNHSANLKWLTKSANLFRRLFSRKRVRPAPTEPTHPRLRQLWRQTHDQDR